MYENTYHCGAVLALHGQPIQRTLLGNLFQDISSMLTEGRVATVVPFLSTCR